MAATSNRSTAPPADDPATVKGQLGPLAAGSYVLRWEVLSVDGHISRADLPFTFPAP